MQTAVKLNKKLKNREITAQSLIESTFTRIDQSDNKINAYISLLKEQALEKATQIDTQFDKGNELPFLRQQLHLDKFP